MRGFRQVEVLAGAAMQGCKHQAPSGQRPHPHNLLALSSAAPSVVLPAHTHTSPTPPHRPRQYPPRLDALSGFCFSGWLCSWSSDLCCVSVCVCARIRPTLSTTTTLCCSILTLFSALNKPSPRPPPPHSFPQAPLFDVRYYLWLARIRGLYFFMCAPPRCRQLAYLHA